MVQVLRERHGFLVDCEALPGATLQAMAPAPGNDSQTARLLAAYDALDAAGRQALAGVLISGGGDDVAERGPGGAPSALQARLLCDFRAGGPYLDAPAVILLVEEVLATCLQATLEAVLAHIPQVPVLVHGYAYPIPDNRGLPPDGAWLWPAFTARGYKDPVLCRQLMRELIDRLNAMQLRVIRQVDPARVRHVDLRKVLDSPDYTDDWQNELHPSLAGFERVAACFARAL